MTEEQRAHLEVDCAIIKGLWPESNAGLEKALARYRAAFLKKCEKKGKKKL
jgi:hypothetical protein